MKQIKLSKIIILVNSLLLSAMVSTAAWFIMTQETSTAGLHMHTNEAINVVISRIGDKWSPDLNLDLGATVLVRETSGDGTKFFSPIYADNVILGYAESDRDDNYIEQSFLIKADSTLKIYLSPESKVLPKTTALKDNIAGAVRIAFYEKVGDELLLIYIWVPNSTYEYKDGGVDKNGDVEATYGFIQSESGEMFQISTANNTDGFVGDRVDYLWGNALEETYNKALLNFVTDDKTEVQKEIVVRVWVEGTDRECVKPLIGGTFNIQFKFYYIKEDGETGTYD